MTPAPIKTKIIPIADNQTIHPTIHRSRKKKIKEMTTAIPSPQSNQYQFYDKIYIYIFYICYQTCELTLL